MPVEFLTSEQQKNYGIYGGEPTTAQLERYFYLDDRERQLVNRRRGNHNRLGFALQLCTVRFLGTFLTDPTNVPSSVVAYLAQQLSLANTDCLSRYLERATTAREHAVEIQKLYGYQNFGVPPHHWQLLRWLYERAWLSAERPSVLFDLTTARLVERKILLPGVTTLTRLIAQVRDRANIRLWEKLSGLLDEPTADRLEKLLVVEEKTRQTAFDRLRRAPFRLSAPSLVKALQRLLEIRALGVGQINLSHIPKVHRQLLARNASTARAQALSRMARSRRRATLLAWANAWEAEATDDVIDMLLALIRDLLSSSEREGKKERLRTLKDLDKAALKVSQACQFLFDPKIEDSLVRAKVFEKFNPEELSASMSVVFDLARPDEKDNSYELVLKRWRQIRQFLPLLMETIEWKGTAASQPILEALTFLKSLEGQKKPDLSKAPLAVVNSKSWQRLIVKETGDIDRRAYTFCVLEQLRTALRRRDVFVTPSQRWRDPRLQLLQGQEWKSSKPQVCRLLGRSVNPVEELAILARQLDQAYRQTAANFADNGWVRLENLAGKETLVLTGLEKLDDPTSLITLRTMVEKLLPRAELPEVLLEIQARTGFASEFTHISDSKARVKDLEISICAVLLAEACNIGLEPLICPDVPALSKDRLSWIKHNYIRSETIVKANARLVDTQANLELARLWGGGEVASADGLRFQVPVRTIHAGPNPKYFGNGRGITYYNFTSDQFTGFHNIVITGTLRDSLYLLEGLLEQETSLRPTEIMTDTHGYSDVVFGLFWLLGYQFSPRLADLGEMRLWRIDALSDYGVLNGLAKNQISSPLITHNWDDFLRVAGSLKLGTVSGSEIMQTLQSGANPSTLSKAIGELGRIAKTLYILAYIDDEAYRRRILTQLNRGESRHSLARAVFHGQKGELRQRYRDGQEEQLGALGLVVTVIVLWNTLYMGEVLDYLRLNDVGVDQGDVARLSPLKHKHINMLGRYQFALPESVRQGKLRPLNLGG